MSNALQHTHQRHQGQSNQRWLAANVHFPISALPL